MHISSLYWLFVCFTSIPNQVVMEAPSWFPNFCPDWFLLMIACNHVTFPKCVLVVVESEKVIMLLQQSDCV